MGKIKKFKTGIFTLIIKIYDNIRNLRDLINFDCNKLNYQIYSNNNAPVLLGYDKPVELFNRIL